MAIKSSQTLVSEALSEVKTITADEALKLLSEDGNAGKNMRRVFKEMLFLKYLRPQK